MTNGALAVATNRAGVVTRLAAFIIDVHILFLTLRGAAWTLDALAPPVNLQSVLIAGFPAFVAAYFVVFWRAIGRTPGKWLMGVKVVLEGGGRITVRQALIRLLGYLLSSLPFYLGFLGNLGQERRGWHDRIAGTEVIYVTRRRRRKSGTAPAKEYGHLLGLWNR